MSGDLLAEAQALSAQVFGPDPVAEAAEGLTMIEPIPAGEPETELDPDASQPYTIPGGRLHAFLASDLRRRWPVRGTSVRRRRRSRARC